MDEADISHIPAILVLYFNYTVLFLLIGISTDYAIFNHIKLYPLFCHDAFMEKQKIVPHLWFDKEAAEAAEFYTTVFPDSRIISKTAIHDTPSGDSDIVSFQVMGSEFMAINAGPIFKINPSISFHAKFKSSAEVDAIWEKLSEGGKVRMELGEYPFSKRYGWIEDKYGVNWQVIQAEGDFTQRITPVLMFTQERAGMAEDAGNLYASIFPDATMKVLARYGKENAPEKEGTVMYAQLDLMGLEFGRMDSSQEHDFRFNEAIAFIVNCEDQNEIDYYWERL